ncbi:calcium/sodium antiporter [Tropicimonas sp.]|uniref:calcium/sodium antiporter n=1 Tax=Tropicimonas sp. TaxID=2067044 RepID=UPI003A85046B
MDPVRDFALVAAGLAALFFGGDRLVSGAVALAERAGISPLVIGLTIVGFGTSAPELVTSIQAALDGSPGIAIGNVVGSNIANILLILGIAALVAPIAVAAQALRRDGLAMAIATLLGAALLYAGDLERTQGLLLLAGLAIYLLIAFRGEAAAAPTSDETGAVRMPSLSAVGTFLVGLALTLLGARLLVDGATSLAESFGVPDAVIGLTVVAVGTSLPELVTSLTAARRGHADVALGNVIGSNIFNILGILGVTALVRPLRPDHTGMNADLLVMIGATALILVFAATDRTISRREGALLLSLYVAYLLWLGAGVA